VLEVEDPEPRRIAQALEIELKENKSKPRLPIFTPEEARFFEGTSNQNVFARAEMEVRPTGAVLDLTPSTKPQLVERQVAREGYGKALIAVSPSATPEGIHTFTYAIDKRITLSFVFTSVTRRLTKVTIRWISSVQTSRRPRG
jgi:hypothetical protein